MLHTIVRQKKNAWLQSADCPIASIISYIKDKGKLRPPQIEAIETYLFLKIEGQNKPLYQLFEEGFFHTDLDLHTLSLSTPTRTYLNDNVAARSLYEFARQQVNGKMLMQELVEQIQRHPDSIPYSSIIRQLFYEVSYADYLFSLPMGSGKTFLMAAFMYLDLYFALEAPDDKRFAHNFLILIPNGLKTSLVPSLRTIEHFDPSWVVQPPVADQLRALLRLEVLDESKSGKKSNKARNPNAQRVNHYLAEPGLMGLVLVVNAEKVVLDRLPDDPNQIELIERSADEKDQLANELRNLIGKLPNLALHIDEVHHAAKDDVQLRRIVTRWQQRGNVTTVLGYTGTPYLKRPEMLVVTPTLSLRLTQISNTVYYYPLVQAIRTFLKKPRIQVATHVESLDIIRQGVREFEALYGTMRYAYGATAKMAIYCSSIERLEEVVLPLLAGELGIPAEDILKFHQGNKVYSTSSEARREFALLDHPLSRKRYVLLVGIGKEGWDCRSLTGVILSQQGDSPGNMVLQTSCRCLRQVERDQQETALIWLNAANATLLNHQLQEEQHTSIAEINSAGSAGPSLVPRHSRAAQLRLPSLHFYQLQLQHDEQLPDQQPDPGQTLTHLLASLRTAPYFQQATIETRRVAEADPVGGGTAATLATAAPTTYIHALGASTTSFQGWLRGIIRDSFGFLTAADLLPYHEQLQALFAQLTTAAALPGDLPTLNEVFDLSAVEGAIRRAFAPLREFRQHTETIPEEARLLVAEKLNAVPAHPNLYPAAFEADTILRYDASGLTLAEIDTQRLAENTRRLALAATPDPASLFAQPAQLLPEMPFRVQRKDQSFHYLPYNFSQSAFELQFLDAVLKLPDLDTHRLEVYFNGERHLTEFRIRCYTRKAAAAPWKYVGLYTPDFLLVQRDADNQLRRVLIIETKGGGYAEQPDFLLRKQFMETEFLRLNPEKFEFLYLPDTTLMADLIGQLIGRLTPFFA